MPVDGRVSGEWGYVIGAYVITWIVFASYAVYLYRVWKQAKEDAANPGGFQ
jgi:hypothetical protein